MNVADNWRANCVRCQLLAKRCRFASVERRKAAAVKASPSSLACRSVAQNSNNSPGSSSNAVVPAVVCWMDKSRFRVNTGTRSLPNCDVEVLTQNAPVADLSFAPGHRKHSPEHPTPPSDPRRGRFPHPAAEASATSLEWRARAGHKIRAR